MDLHKTAKALLASGKGILAADESSKTADKRFDAVGIAKTPEMRRAWRELLFTSPETGKILSGVILYDETLRQKSSSGVPFPELLAGEGIIPGIKVDMGPVDLPNFPGEKMTEGLDGLRARLAEYVKLGAKFAKWRAVITIGEGIPTPQCIEANAYLLAQYSGLCQEAGIVPIVEPEVLLDGTHTIERCEEVVRATLTTLFATLKNFRVDLGGLILKTSMVLPGKDSGKKATAKEVAEATVRVLKETVPKECAGVVFLSGGQSPIEAVEHLNEMIKIGGLPWPMTFSYSRALQDPVMTAWAGKEENVSAAKEIFTKRIKAASAASLGKWTLDLEK